MMVAIALIVLWLVALLTSYTVGGLVHVLLAIAITMILVRVIQNRKRA